jgi:hypothetical protein
MHSVALRRPGIAQVALGLFIVWQILFLAAANLLPILPHGEPEDGELSDSRCVPPPPEGGGPLQPVINLAGRLTDCWTKWTGQMQAWWLFAPAVPPQATFPLVELRWDGPAGSAESAVPPPVRLRSVLEPDDPTCYCRLPGSHDRLFHYEIRLGLVLLYWDEQSLARHPDEWRRMLMERVRRQWRSMRAYLRWRSEHFREEHPERPEPNELVLYIHVYRIPRPGEPADYAHGPVEVPLARWRPTAEGTPGRLPLEAWDPVARRFVELRMGGAS